MLDAKDNGRTLSGIRHQASGIRHQASVGITQADAQGAVGF